jgi:hypothetical protein
MPHRRIPLAGDSRAAAVALSSDAQPDVSAHPDFSTVPIALRIVFSIVFPLFLRRRFFGSLRKGLHCNWGAFSIVNRLYFSEKIFRRQVNRTQPLAAS